MYPTPEHVTEQMKTQQDVWAPQSHKLHENSSFLLTKVCMVANAKQSFTQQWKEWIWVSCSEVGEPRASYTEWSQKENKYCILMHIQWNPEKLYWCTKLQERNGYADVENGLVDTAEQGVGNTNWESSTDIYTLSCVKYITSGKLLYNTGSPAWCSAMT